MIGQNPSDFGDVPPLTEESEIVDDSEMIPAHPTMGSYPPPMTKPGSETISTVENPELVDQECCQTILSPRNRLLQKILKFCRNL